MGASIRAKTKNSPPTGTYLPISELHNSNLHIPREHDPKNDPCFCHSGKRVQKCHGVEEYKRHFESEPTSQSS